MGLKIAAQQRNLKRTNPASCKTASTSPRSRAPAYQLHRAIGNLATTRLLRSGHIQPKLTIGNRGDRSEREADRVADEVMRMPQPASDPNFHRMPTLTEGGGRAQISRKCAECETETHQETLKTDAVLHKSDPAYKKNDDEEVIVQAKSIERDAPEPSSELGSYVASSRGGGQPLPRSTREHFESLFGHDFSKVRVHSDSRSADAAAEVNSQAFTTGSDIHFGAGDFQPGTWRGDWLLAHELTHTIQQTGGQQQDPESTNGQSMRQIADKLLLRRPQRAPENPIHATALAIQRGPLKNDQLTSEATASGRAHLFADQVASVYFASKSNIPTADDHKVLKDLAERYKYTAMRKGGLKGKIIGHADVQPSEKPDNQELSYQRARWTGAVFKTYLAEVAKVPYDNLEFEIEGQGAGFCMSDPDCKRKANAEALALYRRADLIIFTEHIPGPKPTSCPPASDAPVTTLGEYIELIHCAETTTGYSPRQMLAMLRQMYYGEDWSATSQDANWRFVIPCSPSLGNPKAKLGDVLYKAIHDSVDVEGTDVGHVFTGLEAMTCPASSVTLEKMMLSGTAGIKLTVDLSNEAFATWGGDLGATAGAMVACLMMTNDERAKAPKDCHQGGTPQGLEYYFLNLHAPPHDLEGDLAPFVMRAAAAGLPCGNSLEKQYTPKEPISTVFRDFFYNRFPAGRTSKNRYQCFAEAIGATVVDGKITNRGALISKYDTKVMSFAWAYYMKLKKEIPRSDPTAQSLLRHSTGALNLFFDWLQARMQS